MKQVNILLMFYRHVNNLPQRTDILRERGTIWTWLLWPQNQHPQTLCCTPSLTHNLTRNIIFCSLISLLNGENRSFSTAIHRDFSLKILKIISTVKIKKMLAFVYCTYLLFRGNYIYMYIYIHTSIQIMWKHWLSNWIYYKGKGWNSVR